MNTHFVKKSLIVIGLFASMATFGFGFTKANISSNSELVDQVHLSCWDEEGQSSFERIRFVLNSSLTGLVWFSNFDGQELDTGTINPADENKQNFALQILSKGQNFIATIPNFIFQPHVRSIKVTVNNHDVISSLECKKINLQKNQSASVN